LQHFGVTLTSLLENNPFKFHVHLFSGEFEDNELDTIKNITAQYKCLFTFYKLEHKDFDGFFLSNHITLASYYRIFIPELIDKTIPKLLHLDADLIIQNSIEDLWNIEMGKIIIAGIPDPNQDGENNKRLGIYSSHKYLNAGVLLLNCEEWRKNNITLKLKKFIVESGSMLNFHDQDALNKILNESSLILPPKWNQQSAIFEMPRPKLIEVYGEKELDEAINNPCIIHYTGSSKPWDYLNLHPYKAAYFNYLKKTVWKNYTFKNVTLIKRIQKLLMRILGVKRFQKIVAFLSS
jgi:lipopolysaccharide biosynthesis glycosyltransferase